MSIKQNGGVFGRNPTFNDVTIEGQLTFDGDIDINSDLKVDGDLEVTGTSSLVGDLSLGVGNSKEPYIQTTNSGRVETNPGYSFRGNLNTGMFNPQVTNTIAFSTGGTERARISSAGNLSLATGNLVIDTSGKGIDFSATSGTGTSELLDDYEEGSFIPEVRFGGASPSGITYAAKTGTYTKIGNVVEFRFIVTLTAKGSQTGNFEVYGLPYVAASSDNGVGVSSFFNNLTFTGEEVPIGRVENSAVVEFRYPSSGLSTRMTNSQIENNTDLRVSGIYKTA